MLARGARPKEDGQATSPPERDVVLIHLGDKPKKEIRPLFRLRTARQDAALDCEERDILIAFQDEAVRARKKLSRGSYSLRSTLLAYSDSPLMKTVAEKQYPHHGGWISADVLCLVKALPPSEMWHMPRTLAVSQLCLLLRINTNHNYNRKKKQRQCNNNKYGLLSLFSLFSSFPSGPAGKTKKRSSAASGWRRKRTPRRKGEGGCLQRVHVAHRSVH